MNAIEIISKKKHGKELSPDEIETWVSGYADGSIPDYQQAALMMAAKINGLTEDEITYFNLSTENHHLAKFHPNNIKGSASDHHVIGTTEKGTFDFTEIVNKKARGEMLSKDEIQFWIEYYCKDEIPDYQVAALLMAITLKGMSEEETMALTKYMLDSGDIIDLKTVEGVKADKHSTGGVGDKTSIALCPMLSACGIVIAKMSGRGLGFTGGTLDKLESIPGFRVQFSSDEYYDLVKKSGITIIGQSKEIDPADGKLYALRDVTDTVNSLPLIASSIMSKKLASGCDVILLDVKYGSGAFMRSKEDAESLAKLMVKIGEHFGLNASAEITSMAQPLGRAVGNILEVKEAIDTVTGHGPKDFTDLCYSSAATILIQAGLAKTREEAIAMVKENIENGKALRHLKGMVKTQGGEDRYIDDPNLFPKARYEIPVRANKSGNVAGINTKGLGILSSKLGAGRERLDDIIDPTAGIIVNKKLGDHVNKGDILLTMYTERPNMSHLISTAINLYDISDEDVIIPPTVEERISLNRKTGEFIIEKEN